METTPMVDRHDADAEQEAPSRPRLCHRISSVADILDVSNSTVRRLIQDGQLDAIYVGAAVRVTGNSLERLLDAGKRRRKRGIRK